MKKEKEMMTDTEYLLYLWEHQTQMRREILELCGKEEGGRMAFSVIFRQLEKRHPIRKQKEGRDEILKGVCKNLLAILAARGELQEHLTGEEPVYSLGKEAA